MASPVSRLNLAAGKTEQAGLRTDMESYISGLKSSAVGLFYWNRRCTPLSASYGMGSLGSDYSSTDGGFAGIPERLVRF